MLIAAIPLEVSINSGEYNLLVLDARRCIDVAGCGVQTIVDIAIEEFRYSQSVNAGSSISFRSIGFLNIYKKSNYIIII